MLPGTCTKRLKTLHTPNPHQVSAINFGLKWRKIHEFG
uniref:Uncharacterized protein n=1 Tax=Anguilla anguilla TaxID=7936 RepID=A0A0E9USQ8_ANGAN